MSQMNQIRPFKLFSVLFLPFLPYFFRKQNSHAATLNIQFNALSGPFFCFMFVCFC